MSNIIKTTLSEQIYSILREDIISQNIQCGEKLTLKSLQERFNISSTPIREALNRLSQDGLVDHLTNIGVKVITLNAKDLKEIYDFCSLLDVTAMKLAFESEKLDALINSLTKCIELQKESLDSGNMKDFMVYSDNFHDIFFQFADNSRLYEASKKIRSQLSILTTKYQNYNIAKSVVYDEHKNIAGAVANKDFNKAILLMSKHFEYAKSYLLKSITNG
jgi:DNA-binding GntR family transcriptional regulator